MKKPIHTPFLAALLLTLSMLVGGLVSQAAPAASGDIPMRERKTADGIRIVTANVRQMFKADYKTGNGWEDRKELCRDVFLAQNADIFCMQENRTAISDYLMSFMPGFVLSNGVYRSKQPINPIMYSSKRFKKIKEGGFWLSPTPNVENSLFPGATRRVANWVLLKDKTTGKQLYIINAHYTHDSEPIRQLQIDVTLDFARTLQPGIPIVMTADYNCGINSPTITKVTKAGWLDSYIAVHGPEEPGFTFHGFHGTKYGKPKNPKIDFIFYQPPLRPVAAEIIRDSRNGRYPSDHYFISAEFVFEK